MIFRLVGYISLILSIPLGICRAQYYRHLTVETGLPSNRIYKVVEDKEGFIWIATDMGVVKYDGTEISVFNTSNGLPVNDIWDLLVDDHNRIWYFGVSDRLGYIRNDSIFSFPVAAEPMNPYVICYDNKTVLIDGNVGTYFFEDGQWNKTEKVKGSDDYGIYRVSHPEVFVLLVDQKNARICFVYKNGQKVCKKLTFTPGDLKQIRQVDANTVVYSMDHSFILIDLERRTVKRFEKEKFFPTFPRATKFGGKIQLTAGNAWVALDDSGEITDSIILPSHYNATGIFKDSRGLLWVSTFQDGLYMLSPAFLHASYYFMDKPVRFIKKTGDVFVHILGEGLYKWNKSQKQFKMFFAYPDFIHDVLETPAGIWILCAKEMFLLPPNGNVQKFQRRGNRIFYDSGKYYFQDAGGISVYDSTWTQTETIPLKQSRVMIRYEGDLWAGTATGLFRIRQTGNPYRMEKIKENFPVNDLITAGNLLLIGTDGQGIWTMNQSGKLNRLERTAGLNIKNMTKGPDKNVWTASSHQVFSLGFKGREIVPDKLLTRYDGFISDQVNYIAPDSSHLFVASYNGIARIPLSMQIKHPVPGIYRTQWNYSGKTVRANRFLYHAHNHLSLRVYIKNFSDAWKKFYYQLLPGDTVWHPLKGKTISLNRLSPGSYRLRIRTRNVTGSHILFDQNFVIVPRWWQYTWIHIAGFFTVLLLMFILGINIRRFRERRLQMEKELAENKLFALRSQLNPHFIHNALNSIIYYITRGNVKESEKFLVKFSRLIRTVFDISGREKVSLGEELDFLKSYLEMEKLRFENKMDYCIQADPGISLSRTYIPTLLLQPLVENAIKHGILHKKEGGNVCIQIKKGENPGEIVIRILDDGPGFSSVRNKKTHFSGKRRLHSTEVLKKRINLLNQTGKWKINYQIRDISQNREPYNTEVLLKIQKL